MKRFYKKHKLKIAIVLLITLVLSIIYLADLTKFNNNHKDYDEKYMLKMMYLVADKNIASEEDTIDTVTTINTDSILFSMNEVIPLEKKGDYLYGYLDNFTNDKLLEKTTDVIFANNNDLGEVIDGCEYDSKTKTIKIPFGYYENIGEYEVPLESQILSLMSVEDLMSMDVDVSTKKFITSTKKVGADNLSMETNIPLYNDNIRTENLEVYVNNSKYPIDKEYLVYDRKSSILTLSMPAILIDKIDIKVTGLVLPSVGALDKKSVASMNAIEVKEKPNLTGDQKTKIVDAYFYDPTPDSKGKYRCENYGDTNCYKPEDAPSITPPYYVVNAVTCHDFTRGSTANAGAMCSTAHGTQDSLNISSATTPNNPFSMGNYTMYYSYIPKNHTGNQDQQDQVIDTATKNTEMYKINYNVSNTYAARLSIFNKEPAYPSYEAFDNRNNLAGSPEMSQITPILKFKSNTFENVGGTTITKSNADLTNYWFSLHCIRANGSASNATDKDIYFELTNIYENDTDNEMVVRVLLKFGSDNTAYLVNGDSAQTAVGYVKFHWDTRKCKAVPVKAISNGSSTPNGAKATFKLYEGENCTGDLIGTSVVTLRSDGSSTGDAFENLELNQTYCMKEISFTDSHDNALTNYVSTANKVVFTPTSVDSNGICNKKPTITNKEKKYCYRINKVDSEEPSKKVRGTTWVMIGTEDHVTYSSATSDDSDNNYRYEENDSDFLWNDLPGNQDYILKEMTGNPADLDGIEYWNDHSGEDDIIYAPDPNDNDPTHTNKLGTECKQAAPRSDTKVYYCLKVKKEDSKNGEALGGAEFEARKGNVIINQRSVENDRLLYSTHEGVTSFFLGDSSGAGTWTVTETKAPIGYSIYPESKELEAVRLSQAYKSWNQARNACLSSDSEENGSPAIAEDGRTVAVNTYLSLSDYIFEEKRLVINWYKTNGSGLDMNGAEFIVKTNDNPAKYLTVSSEPESYVDDDNNLKSCYVYTGTTTDRNNASILVSGEKGSTTISMNGQVCVSGLPEGTYTVEETKPAKYHTFGPRKTIQVTTSPTFAIPIADDGTNNNPNTMINYSTEFKFTKKVTSGDISIDGINWNNITTRELSNFSFNITDTGGNELEFIQISSGVYEYADYNIGGINGNRTKDLKLGTNRNIIVYHLPVGDYSIKEKKVCCDSSCPSCSGNTPCFGYYYPAYNSISDDKFTVTECSNDDASSCASNKNTPAKKTLSNQPTEITLTKKDLYDYVDPTMEVKFENEDERNAFDKIKFRLKQGNTYIKLVRVSPKNCTGDNGPSVYRYVDESLVPSTDDLVTDLYTCGGQIKITHLCRGKDYTIEEYEVPANTVFTLPDAHITKEYTIPFTEDGKMCCSNNTTSANTNQIIDDTPTRIVLFKKNNRTSSDIHEGPQQQRKETATFEVYACTKLNEECTKAKSTGHPIKFGSKTSLGGEMVYPALLNQSGSGTTSLKLTTVGNTGKLVLEYLPANYRYVVVETNGPDGYYNVTGDLAETEIEYIPKNTSYSDVNEKSIIDYPTMIKFKKDDIYKYYSKTDKDKLSSNTQIFDSMTFVLRDQDGNKVTLKKINDGEYRFIQDDGTTNGNNVTDLHPKNGEILITNLYRNETYYIEETKTDTLGNFILPTNIKKPSGIPSGWNWQGHPYVVYNLPSGNSNPTVIGESVTNLINNLPTRVVFEKRDKKTGDLIDDTLSHDTSPTYNPYQTIKTTFNVYRCPKSVAHCRANSNGAELVYFEDRAYIKDSNNVDITNDITSVTPPVLTYKYNKLNNTGVADLVTDRGVLVLAYLPSEYSYSLFEKTAPNGYYQPSGNEAYTDFTVLGTTYNSNDNYTDLTERVENTPTEINFIKSDIYNYYESDDQASAKDITKIFDSMSFVLRDKNGNIMSLKCSSDGDFVSNKNTEDKCNTGEYRYIPVDNNNVIQTLHTKNGNLKITHLYRGETYYIEEIDNDPEQNFILPDYMNVDLNYGDQLPFDNKGHPVVKYILPNNSPSDPTSITAEIKNSPSRVVFEKRDPKYNYLIPDETTTFKVYQCDKDVECHPSDYSTDEERLAAGIRLVNFTERGIINGDREDPGVEVYKYSKLNAPGVTELHPNKGTLVLRYLPSDSDYQYVLLETVAPLNYLLPTGREAETPFIVANTTVEVEEVAVPNSPTGIIIRKYADQDGDGEADEGKLLGGAKFRLYKVTNYNANKKPADQEKEIIRLKTIKDGIYENRPTLDTYEVSTCTGESCSYDPAELGYTDTPWENIDDLIEKSGTDVKKVLKEGTALIQYLEYDTYYLIEEVEAPKGYSLPEKDDNRFTLVHIKRNETEVLDTRDALVNKPTSFTFYKFDEYNTPLDGATFYLQKLDEEKKYNTLTVTKETLENGSVIYKADEKSELKEITTQSGKATVYYLEPGQYRILEIKAPEGYELPKKTINVATFFVDNDGLVYGNNIIANKKPNETIEYLADSKAELVINIQTGKVVIKYGLIITLLIGSIVGLIIFLNKRKK